MNTDSKTFKNYSPEEVDHFLDQIIIQVEKMIEDNKAKNREIALRDAKIEELTNIVKNTAHVQDKLAQYERMESTLKSAIVMAQRTSDQIKSSAHRESEIILEDAKRNVNIFKRKLRGIIEAQLEMVEDIEKVEM